MKDKKITVLITHSKIFGRETFIFIFVFKVLINKNFTIFYSKQRKWAIQSVICKQINQTRKLDYL